MTTYYLDTVNGDDKNDGLTEKTAKKSIEGMPPATDGDTIRICPASQPAAVLATIKQIQKKWVIMPEGLR